MSEILDPNPIFHNSLTDPLRHFACYNDIHNQNFNIVTFYKNSTTGADASGKYQLAGIHKLIHVTTANLLTQC